jgi:hypothetical protein
MPDALSTTCEALPDGFVVVIQVDSAIPNFFA